MSPQPQNAIVYLTPEQIEELKRRYQAKNQSDALLGFLIAAAGFYVLHEMATASERPKRKAKK